MRDLVSELNVMDQLAEAEQFIKKGDSFYQNKKF